MYVCVLCTCILSYICRGEDDVALFDFTSLFASENAARIVERKGHKILLCVAGDSLTEVSCTLYFSPSLQDLVATHRPKALLVLYTSPIKFG